MARPGLRRRTRCLAVLLALLPWCSGFGFAGLLAGPVIAAPPASPGALRVVTLAPHITELVYAAGAGRRLVATVSSSNFPPEARTLPRVGDGLSVNVERLLALQPDLVLAWQHSPATRRLEPVLAGLDIALDWVAPQSLDAIVDAVEDLGRRLGSTETATRKAAALRAELRTLRKRYSARAPVSVFIEVGTAPLYTLGKDALTLDALTSCGARNIFADARRVAPTVGPEDVLHRRPDVVIVAAANGQRIAERRAYWEGLGLKARIAGMDPDALLRPGPRLITASGTLCRLVDEARTAGNQAGSGRPDHP
ncbi:MAG: helical backbone metal receptor [Castellaniella sp.]